MGLKRLLLLVDQLLLVCEHEISTRWLYIKIEAIDISIIMFWSSFEHLIYYQNEDSCAH